MNTIQAFGWSEIGWITLIGFSLVFLLLVCLIGVLTVFGVVATYKKKEKKPAAATAAPAKEQEEEMISEAKVAAIAIALNLYRGAMHDQESEVITIQAIKRAYSPWNSKIHSLTQLPERK
jgi:Na+-transporting methylmalonyl-CoA/oxaloacetate decarboxylase gamma subunit